MRTVDCCTCARVHTRARARTHKHTQITNAHTLTHMNACTLERKYCVTHYFASDRLRRNFEVTTGGFFCCCWCLGLVFFLFFLGGLPVHSHTQTHTYTYALTHTQSHKYTRKHIHTHTHPHTHTHTQTHTRDCSFHTFSSRRSHRESWLELAEQTARDMSAGQRGHVRVHECPADVSTSLS